MCTYVQVVMTVGKDVGMIPICPLALTNETAQYP